MHLKPAGWKSLDFVLVFCNFFKNMPHRKW